MTRVTRPEVESSTGPKRILIVDDEEAIRTMFCFLFERPHYDVTAAPDGTSAILLAQDQSFDLAFVDIVMPDIDGIEASKRLKQIQPHLKIVLMSGYMNLPEDEARAQSGAVAFLPKPFSIAAAMALAERLLFSSQGLFP